MPFALVTIGVLIFVTALNNTWRQFGSQVYKDLFGANGGFVYWVAGITIVGLIGYIPSLKRPSDLFMVLIILAMLLQNKGFFGELQQGLQAGPGGTTGTNTGSGASATGAAAPSTVASGLFSGPLGGIVAQGLAVSGNEPLTTPAPVAGGTPLGFGGIGAA